MLLDATAATPAPYAFSSSLFSFELLNLTLLGSKKANNVVMGVVVGIKNAKLNLVTPNITVGKFLYYYKKEHPCADFFLEIPYAIFFTKD